MPAAQESVELTNRIQQLLKEREEHESAIARIDDTLSRVGSALGGGGSGAMGRMATGRRRGRPPGSKNGQRATGAGAEGVTAAKPGRRGRRGRGSFEISGEQSVLNFIQSNKNPSTKDVNAHWKSEGRGGSADNTLSKLVREKKLKRTNLEGQRGSTYAVV